jgi:hypothetical protein
VERPVSPPAAPMRIIALESGARFEGGLASVELPSLSRSPRLVVASWLRFRGFWHPASKPDREAPGHDVPGGHARRARYKPGGSTLLPAGWAGLPGWNGSRPPRTDRGGPRALFNCARRGQEWLGQLLSASPQARRCRSARGGSRAEARRGKRRVGRTARRAYSGPRRGLRRRQAVRSQRDEWQADQGFEVTTLKE